MIHLIETVYRFLWGDLFVLPIAGGVGISLMVVLLLTAGVFFTLRTRLLPVRLFRDMISAVCEKNQSRDSLSSRQDRPCGDRLSDGRDRPEELRCAG